MSKYHEYPGSGSEIQNTRKKMGRLKLCFFWSNYSSSRAQTDRKTHTHTQRQTDRHYQSHNLPPRWSIMSRLLPICLLVYHWLYMYMQRKDSSISSFWYDNNKSLEYPDTAGYLWEMNIVNNKMRWNLADFVRNWQGNNNSNYNLFISMGLL